MISGMMGLAVENRRHGAIVRSRPSCSVFHTPGQRWCRHHRLQTSNTRSVNMLKLIIVSIFSLALGWIVRSFLINQASYGRAGAIVTQGKDLVARILKEKERIGGYPSQEWFESLGSERFTVEKRLWCYHVPPIASKESAKVLLTVPVDHYHAYAVGYENGCISMRDIESMVWFADGGPRKTSTISEQPADDRTPQIHQLSN